MSQDWIRVVVPGGTDAAPVVTAFEDSLPGQDYEIWEAVTAHREVLRAWRHGDTKGPG